MRAEVHEEGDVTIPAEHDAQVVVDADGPVATQLALEDARDLWRVRVGDDRVLCAIRANAWSSSSSGSGIGVGSR